MFLGTSKGWKQKLFWEPLRSALWGDEEKLELTIIKQGYFHFLPFLHTHTPKKAFWNLFYLRTYRSTIEVRKASFCPNRNNFSSHDQIHITYFWDISNFWPNNSIFCGISNDWISWTYSVSKHLVSFFFLLG